MLRMWGTPPVPHSVQSRLCACRELRHFVLHFQIPHQVIAQKNQSVRKAMTDDPNLRLQRAAIATRDDLRSVIMPGLDRLAQRATHPETVALIQQLRNVTWKHADCLRLAMKNRTPAAKVRQKRAVENLPCWTRQVSVPALTNNSNE